MSAGGSSTLDQLLNHIRTLAPLIREHANETEQQRRLAPPVVTALAEADLFRMYTPRSLGGLEIDPPTFFRVVEAIAQLDGSTGWNVCIGGAAALLGAYLPDQTAETLFGHNPHAIIAGVAFPFGKAEICDGGYRVTGRWPYASGCQHSSWIFCTCHTYKNDTIHHNANGDPEVRMLFAPSPQITIVDTWDVSGLAGTGSHDVIFENIFIPTAYTCTFGPDMTANGTHYQSPLYRYPIFVSFQGAIGAVSLGIAQGAIDLCRELAQSKRPAGTTELLRDRPTFQTRIAEATAHLRSARSWVYAALQQSWESLLTQGHIPVAERADLLLACANATRSAAAAVDIVYTESGASANYRRNPLQRAFRDIHAATQHIGTAPQQYESAGRMLLGLPPLNPMILF